MDKLNNNFRNPWQATQKPHISLLKPHSTYHGGPWADGPRDGVTLSQEAHDEMHDHHHHLLETANHATETVEKVAHPLAHLTHRFVTTPPSPPAGRRLCVGTRWL